jgi:hypothetical protein
MKARNFLLIAGLALTAVLALVLLVRNGEAEPTPAKDDGSSPTALPSQTTRDDSPALERLEKTAESAGRVPRIEGVRLSPPKQRESESDEMFRQRKYAASDFLDQLKKLTAAGIPASEVQRQQLLEAVADCQANYAYARDAMNGSSGEEMRALIDTYEGGFYPGMTKSLKDAAADILTPQQAKLTLFFSLHCTTFIVDDPRLDDLPDIGQGRRQLTEAKYGADRAEETDVPPGEG